MSLFVVNFRPDRSLHVNKTEIIQNQLIYASDRQAHFLDHRLIGFLITPLIFGLFGKRKSLAATTNANQVNTLNPVTENTEHFLTEENTFDLQDEIEDKISEHTLSSTEKNPTKTDRIVMYIGTVLIIGAVVVALLAMVVMIPYIMERLQ